MADPSTKLNKRQEIFRKALEQKETAKISSSLGLKYLGQTTYFRMIQTKSYWLLILDYPKIVFDQ